MRCLSRQRMVSQFKQFSQSKPTIQLFQQNKLYNVLVLHGAKHGAEPGCQIPAYFSENIGYSASHLCSYVLREKSCNSLKHGHFIYTFYQQWCGCFVGMGGREAQRYRRTRSMPTEGKLNLTYIPGLQSINITLNIPIQIIFFFLYSSLICLTGNL